MNKSNIKLVQALINLISVGISHRASNLHGCLMKIQPWWRGVQLVQRGWNCIRVHGMRSIQLHGLNEVYSSRTDVLPLFWGNPIFHCFEETRILLNKEKPPWLLASFVYLPYSTRGATMIVYTRFVQSHWCSRNFPHWKATDTRATTRGASLGVSHSELATLLNSLFPFI
jgi:hypothetical protein